MSELGDLLELLHGARGRWRGMRVVARRWHDPVKSQAAMQRHHEALQARGHGGALLIAQGPGDSEAPPPVSESMIRAWSDPEHARLRVERRGDLELLVVQVGPQWWSYHPAWGATTNDGDDTQIGGLNELELLLDPAPLLASLDFEPGAAAVGADRRGILVRAYRRDAEDHLFGRGLNPAADSYELLVDAERGVLLRSTSYLDDEPFEGIEILELEFDPAFSAETFEFQPPPGEEIRSARETHALPQALSLEEAAREAPFTLLAPTRLPDGWTMTAMLFPGRDRPPMPPSAVLFLSDPDSRHQIRVMEGTDTMTDSLDWERVDVDGETFDVWDAEMPMQHGIDVRFERHGTHVRISGDIDRATLLDLARSFEPAPTELPPLVEQ